MLCKYNRAQTAVEDSVSTISGKSEIIMENITIRLAVPADAPDMAEVHIRSWKAAYKDIIPADFIREKNAGRHELYKRIITDENTNTYVIQYDRKTVGIMRVAPPHDTDLDESHYELHFIYLHPDYFRKRIGAYTMVFAFRVARDLGKTAMTVWVLAENVNSINFYEKCGFAADGKTDTYECGKTMTIIRMRKGL